VAKKQEKPTVKQVLELYDDVKRHYTESGLWDQLEGDEALYELNFKELLNLPKEFEEEGIVLPTARDLIDTAVDHTDIYNARVFVNKKATSPKSEDEMDMLRKFGLGVLYRNNVESSVSPIRVGAKHYWMHGLAVFKTVWDADRYVNKPEQKKGESEDAYAKRIDAWRETQDDSIPIVIQSVNPRHIMVDPYHEGGLFVFETREELCFNVKQQFPQWPNPKSKKITDKVEHISFWTKDYRCELYDREPVLSTSVVKHDYGFIPYVLIDTGLGNVDSQNDMTKRYVGILRYIKGILVSESRDYSIGDVILKRTAFPWGYLKGPNAQGVTDIFQKFGEYNALPDGVEIVDMAPKVPPDALLTWLSVAANYLAAHAAPESVRGMSQEGVRSAADRRLMIAEASTRYQYSNEAFKHGVAKVLSNCARIMKNVIPGDLRVWAKTPNDEFDIDIDKSKMNPPFNFYVEFAPISEEDEYRRHDDLERLVQSGIGTVDWARKQMSNVDPKALEREELKQRIKQDPMIQQVLSQYIAGKLAALLGQRTTAEVASGERPMPTGGEISGRMTTGVPNVAVPGSAQEQQNILKNQRSQTPISPSQGQGGGGAPYK
jgi:hypothetical protein